MLLRRPRNNSKQQKDSCNHHQRGIITCTSLWQVEEAGRGAQAGRKGSQRGASIKRIRDFPPRLLADLEQKNYGPFFDLFPLCQYLLGHIFQPFTREVMLLILCQDTSHPLYHRT